MGLGQDFNPRSSCEERLALVSVCIFPFTFQSTLLMRGATISITKTLYRLQFQSTLLMRGATLAILCSVRCQRFQSTLLMRGATILIMRSTPYRTISIHAPHARSDVMKVPYVVYTMQFQSTLLMRGATPARCGDRHTGRAFQSTLLMRGAT